MTRKIFVFGSNLAGIHGGGAAHAALRLHGAQLGQGIGLQGDSYAIPTKDRNIETLPMEEIKKHVDAFKAFAEENKDLTFEVTRIGCGLAGLTDDDIAPLFSGVPENCVLPGGWRDFTPEKELSNRALCNSAEDAAVEIDRKLDGDENALILRRLSSRLAAKPEIPEGYVLVNKHVMEALTKKARENVTPVTKEEK
jgi:hypothetical protein